MYLVASRCCLGCLVYLRWVLLKSYLQRFGISCRRRYFNIQKILVYYSIVCRVCFDGLFLIEKMWILCRGCLLWLFVVKEFWLRDCVGYLLWLFFDWFCCWLMWLLLGLIVPADWSDCLFWLFCWTVVILWERRKIMVGRCIATLLLLNLMLKWVRSDSNGWSFGLGVYCLLWKRFLVLNVVLRAAQVKPFAK